MNPIFRLSSPTVWSGVAQGLGLAGRGLEAASATASAMAEDLLGASPDDPLDERDPDFIAATLPAYRALTDLYFRPKVRGLELIPQGGPVLLVGNHSGGTLIVDTFAFAYAFYSHFGIERRFHQLAHDLAVKLPALSALLRKYGTIPASHDVASRALRAGAAVLVYPGGDYETYRPSWRSSEIEFGGRRGFVRLALTEDVPIVPVVAIGGQETALFLTRGQSVARLLRLDRLLRLNVVPVQAAPPFGLTLLDLPGRVPLPAQVTIQVLPRIDLRERFGPDPDEDEVADRITEQMQLALDELAAERDLPVVGSVGKRSSQSGAVAALADEQDVPGVAAGDRQADEPWDGYDEMRVDEIARRLKAEQPEVVVEVSVYEQAGKRRKGVMAAVGRELKRRERQPA